MPPHVHRLLALARANAANLGTLICHSLSDLNWVDSFAMLWLCCLGC
jgi:hypothetical protein